MRCTVAFQEATERLSLGAFAPLSQIPDGSDTSRARASYACRPRR